MIHASLKIIFRMNYTKLSYFKDRALLAVNSIMQLKSYSARMGLYIRCKNLSH